jgi:hypothetical protein
MEMQMPDYGVYLVVSRASSQLLKLQCKAVKRWLFFQNSGGNLWHFKNVIVPEKYYNDSDPRPLHSAGETALLTFEQSYISSNLLFITLIPAYLTTLSQLPQFWETIGWENPKRLKYRYSLVSYSGHELSLLALTPESWIRVPLKAWISVCAFILCLRCHG